MKKILALFVFLLSAVFSIMAEYPQPSMDLNGKYGYRDSRGHFVIRPRYDNALSFREGVAMVEMGGKWGFVNQFGRTVAKCIYDEVRDFNFGYALVCKKGKWGAIDIKGKEIVPCQFDTFGEVSEVKVYLTEQDEASEDKK